MKSFLNKFNSGYMGDLNKTILIVEDNMLLSLVYEQHIKNMGYETLDARVDALSAIDAVKEYDPDLVIMDIILEGSMDGIDAMKQIRQFSDIPVIYVSGNSDQVHKQRADETGYVDYLVKPITRNDLKQTIQKAI
ncbi:MAG TPA: response regulator [Balneolales bacterium]|nr:response regulator [Balneolales bacterium]